MRYLIFGGAERGSGGGYDFLTRADSLGVATQVAMELIGKYAITGEVEDNLRELPCYHKILWTHIFDTEIGEVINRFGDEEFPYGIMARAIRVVSDKPTWKNVLRLWLLSR